MNCCNEYGVCTQGQDCAIRGCSQAKGRENVAQWLAQHPEFYQHGDIVMQVDEPSFRETLTVFFANWRYMVLGALVAVLVRVICSAIG
jgi:hypothetical protein